jgi:hypothetical protein
MTRRRGHGLAFWVIVVGAASTTIFADLASAQTRTPFRQCVDRQIPELDDLISSADVVAGGVVEKCRESMIDKIPIPRARADEILAALKLRIVPLVLEHRAVSRIVDQMFRDELVRVCGNERAGFCAELSR